jgi:myo-inositol-1(or 4)-monophosphatase
VQVSRETDLSRTLIACGMDSSRDADRVDRQARLLASLVQRARNFRATNSLVDFAGTIDGRLGACVNHNTRIWDIAAPALLLREAGGRLTDLAGQDIRFVLDADCARRNYAVVGGCPALVQRVLDLVPSSGLL